MLPSRWKSRLNHWQLYVLLMPAILYFLIFHYYPMYGLQIAFKDYWPSRGFWNSYWVGFEHFERLFNAYYFKELLWNTLLINIYQLALFPISIIVALSFNELSSKAYKKFVQTVTYAPHFISVVVMAGMIIAILHPTTGIVNKMLTSLGVSPIAFLHEPSWFKTVFVFSGEWQNLGWGAIIYLAALAGINPDLHEAAKVDGASRLQRLWHINVPGIMPVIVIMFILNMGSFMSIGFEKIYLLQNPLNMEASDVIQTFVYRSGILEGQFSFATAVGLFNSVINFLLLIAVNQAARKMSDTSLW